MSKLFLLYATILIGLVFMIIPNWYTPIDFFLLSDTKISGASFVYFIGERSVLIILAYILAIEAKEFQNAMWVFYWLMVADLADFILTYNGIWFSFGHFPISMNILKATIFGFVIVNELWKKTIS